MNEPTGSRVDGTAWEEARPPHLPDRLTRLSPWVFLFVLTALFHVWFAWREWSIGGVLADPSSLGSIIWSRITAIVTSLLGAALFIRHPDATRRLPLVVVGVVLVALEQLMTTGSESLQEVFARLTPPGDDPLPFVPAAAFFSVVTSLVGVVAVLCIARGIASARRFEDVIRFRRLAIVLVLVSILGVAASLVSLGETTFESSMWTSPLVAIGITMSLMVALAWAYLLVVSLRGFVARDEPRVGWGLVALAATLFVVIRLAFNVVGFAFNVGGAVSVLQSVAEIVLILAGYGSVLGWILLLLAFALGLPSTKPVVESASDITVDRPAATLPDSAPG